METGDGLESSDAELAVEGTESSKASIESDGHCHIDSETADRTSIIYNGEAQNQRKLEREALRSALFDSTAAVPAQVWYDSLRETDDGRFSSSVVGKMQRVNQSCDQARKAQTLFIDRPFNSKHRTYFMPLTPGSQICARNRVINKQDRTGGHTGQDQHEQAKRGKDPMEAALKARSPKHIVAPKFQLETPVYGNPNILLVNKTLKNGEDVQHEVNNYL